MFSGHVHAHDPGAVRDLGALFSIEADRSDEAPGDETAEDEGIWGIVGAAQPLSEDRYGPVALLLIRRAERRRGVLERDRKEHGGIGDVSMVRLWLMCLDVCVCDACDAYDV